MTAPLVTPASAAAPPALSPALPLLFLEGSPPLDGGTEAPTVEVEERSSEGAEKGVAAAIVGSGTWRAATVDFYLLRDDSCTLRNASSRLNARRHAPAPFITPTRPWLYPPILHTHISTPKTHLNSTKITQHLKINTPLPINSNTTHSHTRKLEKKLNLRKQHTRIARTTNHRTHTHEHKAIRGSTTSAPTH